MSNPNQKIAADGPAAVLYLAQTHTKPELELPLDFRRRIRRGR